LQEINKNTKIGLDMVDKEKVIEKEPKTFTFLPNILHKIFRPEVLSEEKPGREFPRSAFCESRPKEYSERFGS
jgi:hypothetical protein